MADRVAVLEAGQVQQVGTPTEIYDHPANLFVAGFIGTPSMNLIPCQLVTSGGRVYLELVGGHQIPVKDEGVAHALTTSGRRSEAGPRCASGRSAHQRRRFSRKYPRGGLQP